MSNATRILIVEDQLSDYELAQREIQKAVPNCQFERVEEEAEFLKALENFQPDVILSEYKLPQFNGVRALELVQQQPSHTPVIIWSGGVSEDTAVECIKRGASNYVLKENNKRLATAVNQALNQADVILYHKDFLQNITDRKLAEAKLVESEARYQGIFENAQDAIFVETFEGDILDVNPRACEIYGYTREEFLQKKVIDIVPSREYIINLPEAHLVPGHAIETVNVRANGELFPVELSGSLYQLGDRRLFLIILRDITERKKAEAELRQQEQRFRALIKNGMDNISLLAKDGTLLWENPATNSTLGYTYNEFINRNIFELMHPDDIVWTSEIFAKVVQEQGSQQHGMFRLQHHDGTWRWMEATATNLLDEPSVNAVVINYRDITERKNAEEELQKSQIQYRNLVETSHDLIWSVDAEGQITFLNSAAKDTFGYEPEELIGRSFLQLLDPENISNDPEQLKASLLAVDEHHALETYVRHRDGRKIALSTNSILLRDENGNITGAMGTSRDITNRKLAEEALREERNLLRTLIDNLPDRIYAMDRQSRKTLSNRADWKASGKKTMEEVIGKTDFDLYPSELAESFSNADRIVLESGQPVINLEEPGLDFEGNPVSILTTKIPLHDEDGNITGLVGVGRDITERKQAEARIKDLLSFNEKILNYSPLGILTYKLSGECVFANQNAASIVGSSAESLMLQNFHSLEAWKQSGLYNLVEKAIATKTVMTGDIHVTSTFGKDIWMTVYCVTFTSNHEDHVLLSILDITERKQAEEKLLQSEQELTEAQRVAKIGSWSFDSIRNEVHWSDELYRIFGVERDHFVHTYEAFLEQIHPEDRSKVKQRNDEALEKGTAFEAEYRIITSSNEIRTISELGYAVTAANGQVVSLFGTAQDITERKRAELERQALFEIMQGLAITDDLQEFLKLTHAAIAKAIYAENFFVVLHHPDTGLFEEIYSVDQFDPPAPPSRLEKSITSYVFHSGEPLLLRGNDFDEFASQGKVELVGAPSASWLGAPLKTSNGTIGVIVVQDYQDANRYSEHDKDFLASIATQVALAVERKQAERNLNKAWEFLQGVQDSLSAHIAILDQQGVIVQVNTAWCEFGEQNGLQNADYCLGLNYLDICESATGPDADVAQEVAISIRDVLSGKQKEVSVEYACHSPQEKRWFTVHVTCFDDGEQKWVILAHENITTRMMAEAALKQSTAQLRTLFEATPDSIMLLDPHNNWSIIDCNSAACKINGYTREELIGKSIDILNGENSPGANHAEYFQRIQNADVLRYETSHVQKNGTLFPIEVSTSLIRLGERDLVLGIDRDISERKRAEQELRDSEERFRLLFENSGEAILITQTDGTILSANPEACRMFGRSLDEIKGLGRIGIVDPSDPRLPLALEERNKTGQFRGELHLLRKDGSTFPAEVSTTIFTDSSGDQKTSMTIRDITERRHAEEAIHEQQRQLMTLISNLPGASYRCYNNPEYTMEFISDGILQLTGYPAEDFQNQRIQYGELIYAEDRQRVWEEIQEALQESLPFELIYRIRTADGSQKYVWEKGRAVHWVDNQADILEGFITDITERKRAETAEREQRILAEALRDTSEILSSSLDYGEVLDHILAAVGQVVRHDAATIMLIEDGFARVVRSKGYEKHIPDYDVMNISLPLADTTNLRMMLETKQPVVVYDTHSYPGWRRMGPTDWLRSNVGAPISIDGKVIGFILLDCQTPGFFTSVHAERLEAFANQAAVAIHNANLLQQAQNEIAERKQAEMALQQSQARYYDIFDNSPISLWEEDYSLVKEKIESLQQSGITDLNEYLSANPNVLLELGSLVKVIDVNRASLGLFHAETKEDLLGNLLDFVSEDTVLHLRDEVTGLTSSEARFTWEGKDKTLDGQELTIMVNGSIAPGYEQNWSKVIVSIHDVTERKQAEDEIDRRAKETYALLETALALTNLDLKAILQTVGNSAKALFAADGCRVFLMQPDGETLRCVLAIQESATAFSDLKIKLGEGVTGSVAASGKAEIINNMLNDPRAVQVAGTDEEEEAIMFAPLKERDHTVGVLSIRRAGAERPFQPADLELLEAFASIAASAVSNARLFEEAQQRLDELEAIYENGLAVSQLLEPREIGNRIIETFTHYLSWHHVTIRLLRPETDQLEVIAFHVPGLHEDQKSEMADHFNQMIGRVGQGLSGWVVQTGIPLRIGDVHSNPHYVNTQAGIKSGLYMPLKIGDRAIGVISVESEAHEAFTEQDERLLATLASQAAVAFENARLYQAAHQELLERTRAQAALWASETHYRELADSITDILFELDYSLQYTHWNKASEMFSGIPAEDAIGKTMQEVWGISAEPLGQEEIYKSVLKDRQAKTFEIDVVMKGQKRSLEITAYPSTRGVSVVARDVTERRLDETLMQKRVELMEYSAHHSLEELMQRTVDEVSKLTDSHIGFLTFIEEDQKTISLRAWSSETLQIFGALGDKDLHHSLDTAGVWADAFRQHKSVIHNDYETLPGKKGLPEYHPKVIRELVVPIVRDDRIGAILGIGNKPEEYTPRELELVERFADYAWDIIERRQMEAALAEERNQLAKRVEQRTADLSRANSNLARALRVKDEFLANMSHELRTPLNAILGLSESLGEQVAGPLNEKQQKYLNTINESGHHLLSLINDILDLAKIEAGQITLDINKVDINSVCQASLRMIKQLAQKKNQEVLFEIDRDLGLMWADERRLKQMIVNLLSNAVKFTPESGKLGLEVRGDPTGNRVLITVWDKGIGISEQDMDRLFKPFVQLDSGLAREATGTGLGLALVAQMARLHGGSVSLESQLGEGSRFTIMLPWEPALAVDASTRLKNTGKFRAIDPNATNKPTILVIEDTREVVMMLVDYLEMSGYKMVTAQDGADGIQQAKLSHPNLILMDVMMPGMDGFETTRKLRLDPQFKDTPIIALTALAMPSDRQRCLDAGMDEYISKPVNLKALVKLIRSILLEKEEPKSK